MRPRARSARPGLEPIFKKKLSSSRNKRDDKVIAHSDGFELMKIMDVENIFLQMHSSQGTPTKVDLEKTEST